MISALAIRSRARASAARGGPAARAPVNRRDRLPGVTLRHRARRASYSAEKIRLEWLSRRPDCGGRAARACLSRCRSPRCPDEVVVRSGEAGAHMADVAPRALSCLICTTVTAWRFFRSRATCPPMACAVEEGALDLCPALLMISKKLVHTSRCFLRCPVLVARAPSSHSASSSACLSRKRLKRLVHLRLRLARPAVQRSRTDGLSSPSRDGIVRVHEAR